MDCGCMGLTMIATGPAPRTTWPPPNKWTWGYKDEAQAQVSLSYVCFSFFFIQLSSPFIIYRVYLMMAWQPQPMYLHLHLWMDCQTMIGCICTQCGSNDVYCCLGPPCKFFFLTFFVLWTKKTCSNTMPSWGVVGKFTFMYIASCTYFLQI